MPRQTECRAGAKIRARRVRPCVIPLSDMHLWTVEMGDPEHIARNISLWLSAGALPGNPENKRDVWNVMDAVQSLLRDLWSMPPLPIDLALRNGAVPVEDLTITERDTGKIVDQIEVMSANVRS